MAVYKLIYFPIRGRAETARFIFAFAGVPHEEVVVEKKDWSEYKKSTPYGKLPILDVDGEQIADSGALTRYLANKFGLAGESEIEKAKIEALAGIQGDVIGAIFPYILMFDGALAGDKEVEYSTKVRPTLKEHFTVLVKHLQHSTSGYLFGSGISWIDFTTFTLLEYSLHFNANVLDEFPDLKDYMARIQNLPQLKEFFGKRHSLDHLTSYSLPL